MRLTKGGVEINKLFHFISSNYNLKLDLHHFVMKYYKKDIVQLFDVNMQTYDVLKTCIFLLAYPVYYVCSADQYNCGINGYNKVIKTCMQI